MDSIDQDVIQEPEPGSPQEDGRESTENPPTEAAAGATQSKASKSKGGLMGVLAAIGAFLLKAKGLAIVLFSKLKFLLVGIKYLKFGKILTTGGSMAITIVIDAMRWGWAYATGFVLLIFVHEMGHVIAIRAKGLKAGAPVFIPFVGAMIALKEMPHDAKSEAEIGIAGPVLGTVGALLCLEIGKWTGSMLFVRLAYVGFMINLFNLLPVLPLDGGRVMAAISPKVWMVGLALTGVMFLWTHNPIFLILVILSIGRMWHGIKSKPEEQEYYNVPRATRVQMTVAYFGLAAYLAVMMMQLHIRPGELRPSRVVTSGHGILMAQTMQSVPCERAAGR